MRVFKIKSLIIFLLLILSSNLALADSETKNAFRTCSPLAGNTATSNPHPANLFWEPLNGEGDFYFESDNSICQSMFGVTYGAFKASIAATRCACGTGSCVPNPAPTMISDIITLARSSPRTATNPACQFAYNVALTSLYAFGYEIAFQFVKAREAYNHTSLCGGDFPTETGSTDNWTAWNSQTMSRDIPKRKQVSENVVTGWIQSCDHDPNSTDCNNISSGLNIKEYRQWYYGGVERVDISEDACPDVSRIYQPDSDDNKSNYVSHDQTMSMVFPTQRYYMRGTDAGNYACERFNPRLNKGDPIKGNLPLSVDRGKDYEDAYRCCIKKSKSTVCVERKYCKSGGLLETCPDPANNIHIAAIGGGEVSNIVTEHKFCYAGSRCIIGSGIGQVEFQPSYQDSNRMICVETYNLCPFNFNLGGGSNECDYFKDGTGSAGSFTPINPEDIANQTCNGKSDIRNDNCSFNDKVGKCRNYCQYLNHCVVVGGNDYVYDTQITSPYFSRACVNFIGDSKNQYGYGAPIGQGDISITGNQKHFTAPIAQCVRETLENIFYNRAGHTRCGINGEYPDNTGKCYTNLYSFKEGNEVEGNQSFFSRIQDNLTSAIKMALTIAVMMQGLKILLTGAPIKQAELTMYVVKIALVLFFATGNAWQGFFFNGVYNASATFSNIVMNIRVSSSEAQRDGCQFGEISMPNGTSAIVSEYPQGKEYLSVFDTFDCKIARYLGYGPSATVANIAKLVFASFFTGGLGVLFASLTMVFGCFMIVVAFRALHIFLTSAFSIILLVYISPITITAALFKRTEGMFNTWLGELIGASLQPIILFTYMGIFITVFETLVTGSATFRGQAPERKIVCEKICVDRNGAVINLPKDQVQTGCHLDIGQRIIDPMNDSVACMMNLSNEKFGKIPVLESFGISIPILKDFFSSGGRDKILAMIKAVLVIFILNQFMDEIPGIATKLMGGTQLPGSISLPFSGGKTLDARTIFTKIGAITAAVQKRATGAVRQSSSAAAAAASRAKGIGRSEDKKLEGDK